MDFVSDSLSNGRRIKCLTVADDFSYECIYIAVDLGISGPYVTRLLDQAAIFSGYYVLRSCVVQDIAKLRCIEDKPGFYGKRFARF